MHWCWRADTKGSDTPSPSGIVVDAENVKPVSLFLAIGARKGIRPVKLHTKILYEEQGSNRLPRPTWKVTVKMTCVHVF